MAHVEDRRDQGRGWRVRYRDPSGQERSKSFKRKVDADRFLIDNEATKLSGRWVDPRAGRVLFGAFARDVFADRLHLRPSTRSRDESYLRNHVLAVFERRPLASISRADVQEWVRWLSNEKELAPELSASHFEFSRPFSEKRLSNISFRNRRAGESTFLESVIVNACFFQQTRSVLLPAQSILDLRASSTREPIWDSVGPRWVGCSERTSTFSNGASRLLARWNVSAVAIATLKTQNQPRVVGSFLFHSSSWKSLLNT